MTLKVLHLSTYAGGGGAARAAANVNSALQQAGVDSQMVSAQGNKFKAARAADRALWKLQRSPIETWRSPARFGSLSAKEINNSGADIINLHWVTDGFVSIEEIGRIEIPLVWSMYDMWPISGTEHYGNLLSPRWREGYSKLNRPSSESGFDLDLWTFGRKWKQWQSGRLRLHMVPASTWLEEATRSSFLMHDRSVSRIPHAIDTETFAPMNREMARAQFDLQVETPLLLFLASAGITDSRKGWDLLSNALRIVADQRKDVQVIVAGPRPDPINQSKAASDSRTVIHWMGEVSSNEDLRSLYAGADIVTVPSREDNLPLTAMEAQACGTPVIGFNTGGLPNLVEHSRSGYLARPFDVGSLAEGILVATSGGDTALRWGEAARQRAVDLWSSDIVSGQYLDVYRSLLNSHQNST